MICKYVRELFVNSRQVEVRRPKKNEPSYGDKEAFVVNANDNAINPSFLANITWLQKVGDIVVMEMDIGEEHIRLGIK